jgi:hypothetical protein
LWHRLLSEAGVPDPFRLTPEIIMTGAAALRAGNYRSTMAYVDIAVQEFVRRGGSKTQLIELTVRDTRRACERGLGPPKHAGAFPLDRIPELSTSQTGLVPKGPMWPARTLLCGCWWLTREIELSNSVVGDITRPEPSSIRWNLPASKSDPRALGMARTHICACGLLNSGVPSVKASMCPACNLWAQAAAARAFAQHIASHPVYFDDDVTTGELFPLFPTKHGHFPSKGSMIGTIISAAQQLNLETMINGKPIFGGHSLRRGGAQFLARSGVDVWRIQALARHSGSAILLYLDGVHAESLGNIAAEAYLGRDLSNVRDELKALRAKLLCQTQTTKVTLTEALPDDTGTFAIPLTVADILALPTIITAPSDTDMECYNTNPFVLSSRHTGRCHQRNPDTIGIARCGWKYSLQKGAIFVDNDNAGLGCTKCARKAATAAARTADVAAAAAEDTDSGSTSSSDSTSPSSASGGE